MASLSTCHLELVVWDGNLVKSILLNCEIDVTRCCRFYNKQIIMLYVCLIIVKYFTYYYEYEICVYGISIRFRMSSDMFSAAGVSRNASIQNYHIYEDERTDFATQS